MFPLMLIAGMPVLKNKYLVLPILLILCFQSYHSVKWMRQNATTLAPCQAIRTESGQWLQDNIDHSEWVVSSDIGAIAYTAKDCLFIDMFGLTSSPEYKNKNPRWIADSFGVSNGRLTYTKTDSVNAHIIKLWKYKPDIYIGIARIE
jgi:hypothetical protein